MYYVIRSIARFILLTAFSLSFAHATTITYTTTQLAGNQWRSEYVITNNTLNDTLREFTIFFDQTLYGQLFDASGPAGWDLFTANPDRNLPADGYFDGLALSAAIQGFGTIGGFAVTFEYFGTSVPGAQLFSIVDPETFVELDAGVTQATNAIPIPASPWLILCGTLAMLLAPRPRGHASRATGPDAPSMKPPQVRLAARCRARSVTVACLAMLVSACGARPDAPAAAAPAPVMLAAITATPAASQLQVTALQKVAEKRINRTTYEYTYLVSIRNNGSANATNVVATLSTAGAGTEIIDATVVAGTINAGATVTPSGDVVVIRQDRTVPFSPDALGWGFASANEVRLDPVKPAEVVILSLADLGFPGGADKVVPSGAVSDALVSDGTLRFATPGDPGVDQEASLAVQSGTATTVFRVLIRTQRPRQPLAHVEPLEDGSSLPAAPTLTIAGLGPDNAITGAPLTFKLNGTALLDLKDDSDGLVTGPGNSTVSLKNFWVFNPSDSSFSISGQSMQQLLGALPNGALTMALNFVSKDGEFAVSYELLATKQGAKLSGKLQSPQGNPVTSLAGRKILLKGFNVHLRAAAVVDANGSFVFEGVLPDTYQLTLSDLQNPNLVSASTVIFAYTTTAEVTLVVPLGAAIQAGAKESTQTASSAITSSYVASKISQNGSAPAKRDVRAAAVQAPPPAVALSADASSATFSATAAGYNETITTPINFSVPAGTRNVGVTITVQTAEYPYWTTQQSQYNDAWSYAVLGLPATVLSDSGSVNQSHYTQGTVTRSACVDVTKQAKDAVLAIGGAVSATNIGDSQLPTTTTVELSLACKGLKITAARFASPNADAHPVLSPITTQGNLIGPYLSIPQVGSAGTHTIPLEIDYAPADAKLTEVNIGVSPDGKNPAFTADNLLGQAHTNTPGKIKFSNLSLPVFPGGMVDGKLVVTVRIKGTVEDTEVSSDPVEGGQVAFDGATAFTPLYVAGNVAGLSGRRYGTRDAGGDSWSTRQSINWLSGKAYRFDDISGMHVTQTTTGRSILGHSGHSDGQQIDMRYADGQGGFGDGLGGQGNGAQIAQLIHGAATEVAAAAAQKPKLSALQAWIAANRTLLDLEAANSSTRVIYIGPSFIKLALIDAKFPAVPPAAPVAIPGMTAWTKPARVHIDAAHLSHWHMSMTAHP